MITRSVVSLWITRVALAQLLLYLVTAIVLAQLPTQDTVNASQQAKTDALIERVGAIEKQELHPRLKVVESDMGEIKLLLRGIGIAIAAQLIIQISFQAGRKQP